MFRNAPLFQDRKTSLSVAVKRPSHKVIEELIHVRLPVRCLKCVVTSLNNDVAERTIRLLPNPLECK
jgi:hypothetical protein